MRRTISLFIVVLCLLAWAPWITDEYAVNKVVEKLGSPDAQFHYLDRTMSVRDVPKEVHWLPFSRYVLFPGEAGWFVTLYGAVVP